MAEFESSLRARLLELQPLEGPGRLACEQELARLFERKLGRFERLRYLVPACAALVMALGLSTLSLSEPDSTPRTVRILLLGMAILGAWWFVICWRILRRGSVTLTGDRRRIAATALGCTLLQTGWFAWRAIRDPSQGAALAMAAPLFVLALVIFVRQRRRESAAHRREQELRAQLSSR